MASWYVKKLANLHIAAYVLYQMFIEVLLVQSSVFFLMPVKFAILYTLANLLFVAR